MRTLPTLLAPPSPHPPQALPVEYSLAPDAPQIAFRQLRAEWVKMGYAVPPEEPGRPRRGLLDGMEGHRSGSCGGRR